MKPNHSRDDEAAAIVHDAIAKHQPELLEDIAESIAKAGSDPEIEVKFDPKSKGLVVTVRRRWERSLFAFAFFLVLMTCTGAAIGLLFGLLSEFLFNLPGHPVLRGVYRGVLIGVVANIAYWHSEGWWHELPRARKIGAWSLSVAFAVGLVYLAWLTVDFLGTIVIVLVALMYFLRKIESA